MDLSQQNVLVRFVNPPLDDNTFYKAFFTNQILISLIMQVKKAKRAVCLIISTLVLAGLIFSLVFMVIPLFRETLSAFVDSMPNYVTNLETLLNSMALWLEDFGFVIPAVL